MTTQRHRIKTSNDNPETQVTLVTRHRIKTSNDNPETQATLVTRHRIKTNKTRKMSNTDPNKKTLGVNSCACKG